MYFMTTQWLSFLSVLSCMCTKNDAATAQEDERNEGFLMATNKAEGTRGSYLSLPGVPGQEG